MAQYIPKKSLVAEIEKLISNGKLKYKQSQENNDRESYIAWSEHIATCGKILLFLNTLEVKEIDTEQLNKLLNWWKGVTTDYSAYKVKEVDLENYNKVKKVLSLSFMHFLDANRPEGKMCLSNGECFDIEKAFDELDFSKLFRYMEKYLKAQKGE